MSSQLELRRVHITPCPYQERAYELGIPELTLLGRKPRASGTSCWDLRVGVGCDGGHKSYQFTFTFKFGSSVLLPSEQNVRKNPFLWLRARWTSGGMEDVSTGVACVSTGVTTQLGPDSSISQNKQKPQ